MRAERSRGRLERSASLSGDSGVHPPSASSTRASFRDHIGLAEHIHRKSFEVKEMHELLVERLRGIGEKEEASREDDKEWCREKSDQNPPPHRRRRPPTPHQRQSATTLGGEEGDSSSLFTHSPMTSLGKIGRRRATVDDSDKEEEEEEEEEEENGTIREQEEMIRMLQASKAQRSVAELVMMEDEKEDTVAGDGEEQRIAASSSRSSPPPKHPKTMSPSSNGTATATITNKKKSAATETDYFIDIENLKKERNALKQELAELGEDVEYHRMASAASRIECDNNEDEKQRLQIEVQDLEVEIREVENRFAQARMEMQRAEQEASCKISLLKELDHEQEEAERELERLKESCLEEERKMEEKLVEREAVEEALHSLRGELEEEKMWKAQFLDEVREAERQAKDATTTMKNANEKTRIERKNFQLLEQKRQTLAKECEKLLEMKKDIETFLEVKTRERAMLLDGRVEEEEEEEENFPLVEDNDEEAEEKDEDDEDASNGLTSSASTFSTPGKDSDYTQYSPDSPLPAQHQQMKYSFTPKQNSVEEHGAFTPGGSMKTSPRISALIEKAAKSPLRANVGNGIVLDGIGMEDGEEGRRNVQQQQQQQQQDLLLSPWLMTFEDTPPEKKQNLIDLKTPPAPRDESVRLHAEFIKTQQNVTSASELKKQSSSKSKKKNNSDVGLQKERELASLREKLEMQERRLRELEDRDANSRRPKPTEPVLKKDERKIEARVRLLQALQMK